MVFLSDSLFLMPVGQRASPTPWFIWKVLVKEMAVSFWKKLINSENSAGSNSTPYNRLKSRSLPGRLFFYKFFSNKNHSLLLENDFCFSWLRSLDSHQNFQVMSLTSYYYSTPQCLYYTHFC